MFEDIAALVERLCIQANTILSPELAIMLECASEDERCDAARSALEDIVENFKFAAEAGLPICQDTGMAVVFAEVGQEVHISGNVSGAVNEGVRRG